ncbi:MAG: glycerol kinase GlpK [Deltaproteobacteria bacterium]|nr:glycerol kinase GlpK [Deltaproteobacteria bacterium]
MSSHVLAIDEGGSGVRAYIFDHDGREVATAHSEISLLCPRPGWVEHDPLELWTRSLEVARAALKRAGIPATEIAGLGICNQRASALVWDADTGKPIYPAIGWQDLRTVEYCNDLGRRGYILSPLQSASKFSWVLENVPGARARADAGRLRFGTVDTWLTWQLSGGTSHVTDDSNASCTGVYDFLTGGWDAALLESLHLPHASFPAIVSTSAIAGVTDTNLFGAPIPLAARAGDQQAAMFGQLRIQPGMMKITYGTAAMMDLNVGPSIRLSPNGCFPLVLWELDGARSYCLEGSAVTVGAAMQWLRDGLGILSDVADSEAIARSVEDSGGVWCIPAFQGLGTPYLDPGARAVIGGLSRATGRAQIIRAVLEGIAFRCGEVIEALRADAPESTLDVVRVDGGAARNDFLMQCQADVTGVPVERPVVFDAACLGAAYLAGLATGFWRDVAELDRMWRRDKSFEPRWSSEERTERMARWKRIVELGRRQP